MAENSSTQQLEAIVSRQLRSYFGELGEAGFNKVWTDFHFAGPEGELPYFFVGVNGDDRDQFLSALKELGVEARNEKGKLIVESARVEYISGLATGAPGSEIPLPSYEEAAALLKSDKVTYSINADGRLEVQSRQLADPLSALGLRDFDRSAGAESIYTLSVPGTNKWLDQLGLETRDFTPGRFDNLTYLQEKRAGANLPPMSQDKARALLTNQNIVLSKARDTGNILLDGLTEETSRFKLERALSALEITYEAKDSYILAIGADGKEKLISVTDIHESDIPTSGFDRITELQDKANAARKATPPQELNEVIMTPDEARQYLFGSEVTYSKSISDGEVQVQGDGEQVVAALNALDVAFTGSGNIKRISMEAADEKIFGPNGLNVNDVSRSSYDSLETIKQTKPGQAEAAQAAEKMRAMLEEREQRLNEEAQQAPATVTAQKDSGIFEAIPDQPAGSGTVLSWDRIDPRKLIPGNVYPLTLTLDGQKQTVDARWIVPLKGQEVIDGETHVGGFSYRSIIKHVVVKDGKYEWRSGSPDDAIIARSNAEKTAAAANTAPAPAPTASPVPAPSPTAATEQEIPVAASTSQQVGIENQPVASFSFGDAFRKLAYNAMQSKAARGDGVIYKDYDWGAYKYGEKDGNQLTAGMRDKIYGAADKLSGAFVPSAALWMTSAALGLPALPVVFAAVTTVSGAMKLGRIAVESSKSETVGMALENNFKTEVGVAKAAIAPIAVTGAVVGAGAMVMAVGPALAATAITTVALGAGATYLANMVSTEVKKFTEVANTAMRPAPGRA